MSDPADQLAANALVSLEEARAFLQKDQGEEEQDELIVALINAASSRILQHTGREFAPKGVVTETRVFATSAGARTIDLFPFDVREVSAVILGSDLAVGDEVALASTDWRLRPLPSPHGVYQLLRLTRAAVDRLGCDEFEVSVTGLWGFAAVPEDVKHWCKVTVAIWLRKDVSAFSRTLAIDEDRLEVPEGLPSSVSRALCDFTRKPTVLPR
jgi:hypothetical protein